MATNKDVAGNTVNYYPELAWCLIGNPHQTTFLSGDQEFWEYVGIDPETALMIAQGFPDHWFDVEPRDQRFERAESHRRAALPALANASIPLPSFSGLATDEQRPTFDLMARYNLVGPGWFDPEAEYARYPFALLHKRHPPHAFYVSSGEWEALLGDLFRLLYRSGHGHIHPDAVKEDIPKRWILHNSPILNKLTAVETNPPLQKSDGTSE